MSNLELYYKAKCEEDYWNNFKKYFKIEEDKK